MREGNASDAHQLGRYAARRRPAILVATVLDLQARLTDAVLDMADKLVGGLFAKARNATRRRYAAGAGNVGRLIRLFHGTIDGLATARANERDAFETVDETVGRAKLLRVRGEVADLANLAEEDPLLRAAARWKTLHKLAPDLVEALEFRAARRRPDVGGAAAAHRYEPVRQTRGAPTAVRAAYPDGRIREHWDDVRRLVASLQAGTVLPSAMLKRLAAFQRQNQLDLALQELGRIERTLFMLDWLESPQLRQRCQAGLNKSEQRHALARVICTFKQGRIADRGHDAQQFRAAGLNLVIAAIVYWNTTCLADAVNHLRSRSQALSAELLAHSSPLTWEHIGFSGDFLCDRAAATAGQRQPLNLSRERRAA